MSVENAATWATALGAVAYGTGDFVGGFASRRLTTFSVVAIAQAVAVVLLLQYAVLDSGPFSLGVQNWVCVFAGLAYAAGVIVIYEGLAHGRVAIVYGTCSEVPDSRRPISAGGNLSSDRTIITMRIEMTRAYAMHPRRG